jgi:hypothetical protein
MFLGLFISSFLSKIIFRKKLFYPVSSAILAACVLLACFLPLCPTHKNGLSLLVTSNTWKETDDGPRSFWGYCFSIRNYSARKRIPDELDRYKCNPENLLIAGPYDGWVSGTQSQSYVLFIVKNCEKIKADSEYVFGEINGKKIVLTDPSNISQNLEKHFSSAGIIPVQIFVELPLNDIENQVLKQISVSEVPVTIDALIKELGNDKETISKAVTELRKRGLIELTGNDTYKLIYKIE